MLEKQSGHLTPKMGTCNHAVTNGSLGTILSIYLDSICLFIISLVSPGKLTTAWGWSPGAVVSFPGR